MKQKLLTLMLAAMMVLAGIVSIGQAAEAQTSTVVEAEGSAPTRAEAVKNALVEAVRKTTGVYVNAGEIVITDSKSTDTGSSYNDRVSTSCMVKSGGFVESYSILNERKETDSYYVKLRATIFVSKLKNDKRKAIAISRITTPSRCGRQAKIFTEQFLRELNSALLEARKFRVLDRSLLEAQETEVAIASKPEADPSETRNLGQRQSAQYLVDIVVYNVDRKRFRGARDASGKRQRFVNLKTHASWTVVCSASGRVLATSDVYCAIQAPSKSSRDLTPVKALCRALSAKIVKQISTTPAIN